MRGYYGYKWVLNLNLQQILDQIDLRRMTMPYDELISSYIVDLLYKRADQLSRKAYRAEWLESHETPWKRSRKVHNCST